MDDNQNKNQPNTNASDYQKILDEYAASVKPDITQPPENLPEEKIPADSLKETVSLPPEPKKITAEVPGKTLADDLEEALIQKKPVEPIKPSPVSESPIHPSLAVNLEENDSVESKPANLPPVSTPKIEPPVENIPEPIKTPINETQTSESKLPQPEKTPEEIKAEINRLLADDETKSDNSDTVRPAKKSPIGKVFFIFALILFLLVAAGLAYFLFLVPSNSNNPSKDTTGSVPTNSVTPTDTPVVSGETCELNDKTYQVGESFQSADGCNTCSCQSAGVIICTEKACTGTPVVTSATKSATTTSSIPSGWKTYTDSTYKFSINYPSDWVINKEINSFSLASAEMNKKIKSEGLKPTNGPEISVSVYDSFSKLPERMIGQSSSKNTKTLKEYVNFYLSKVKEITINGINGYSGYTELPSHDIYLQKGNIIIFSSEIGEALTNYGYTIDQKTIDTIINTIKFN